MSFGVVCRILLYSSLALGTRNNVTIELSTPAAAAPDGVLLCFAASPSSGSGGGDAPAFNFTRDDVSVPSLQEGGTIWRRDEVEQVAAAGGQDWRAAAFFQGPAARWGLAPAEATRAASMLGTDAYYSRSYVSQLYDDLRRDQDGAAVPRSAIDSGGGAANCVLLTGAWRRAERYQLTLSVPNPRQPDAGAGAGAGAAAAPTNSSALAPPVVWMAPLSYADGASDSGSSSGGGGCGLAGLAFAVRGSKQGALCPPRAGLAAATGPLFDAYGEAAARGLALAAGAAQGDPEACLDALRAVAATATPAAAPPSPLALPPVRALGLDSLAPPACAPGAVRGPRLGGDCVACGSGAPDAAAGGACACWPGFEARLAGGVACGGPLAPGGGGGGGANASDAAGVAAALCADFSAARRGAEAGRLADRAVARLHLRAFLARSGRVVDRAGLDAANASFWSGVDFDPRAPGSPTRRHGVAPRCNRCGADGAFEDIYSGQRVPVRDDRFAAVRALRLIGYALHAAGHPCPELWDAADPLRDDYGRRERAMCSGGAYAVPAATGAAG
ncbi:hypothetical protein Rsub_11031 [Raphidocelis subcapitata]|uniref:Uncharacterized protein n=1 Tax=Raphidocelis subcapitata TaxID=307507 RepID=A0A2V0PC10_9CHLO|nr:hypothetical protein Rsub_11031 [Raphidocelis subcapitata]|eukprot:GBF97384.1 hypothetical protein Rsub_11031 [Raphidocelis subcapitata]